MLVLAGRDVVQGQTLLAQLIGNQWADAEFHFYRERCITRQF